MRNTGLDKAQAGIKTVRVNNLRYADDITLIAESKKKTKEPPDESERESEKVGLKFNIQKT